MRLLQPVLSEKIRCKKGVDSRQRAVAARTLAFLAGAAGAAAAVFLSSLLSFPSTLPTKAKKISSYYDFSKSRKEEKPSEARVALHSRTWNSVRGHGHRLSKGRSEPLSLLVTGARRRETLVGTALRGAGTNSFELRCPRWGSRALGARVLSPRRAWEARERV